MDVCNELPGYMDSLHHLVAIEESTKSHFNNFNKWLLDIKSFRYTITFFIYYILESFKLFFQQRFA